MVEAGEPLGFVAAQRGDAGDEGVGDELLHRLHALGHDRGQAPGLRPASEPSLPPLPPARPGAAPLRSLQPTARSRRGFGFRDLSPSLPLLSVPRGFASHPWQVGTPTAASRSSLRQSLGHCPAGTAMLGRTPTRRQYYSRQALRARLT